jgi:hypothetical protein
VERTFAWLGQARRLAKDYERLPQTAVAMIYWAMSRIMLRRLVSAAEMPQEGLLKGPSRAIAKQFLERVFSEVRTMVSRKGLRSLAPRPWVSL